MTENSPLKKNDIISLEITDFTSEGSGVGHYNGQAVFVSGAAAGDMVETLIIKTKKSYAVGKIQSIVKASPDRIIPECPAFPRCGGCVYRHISYSAETRLKQQRVAAAFERLGHMNIEVSPITGCPDDSHYRNKAQYPVDMINGRLMTGFYAAYSHRVIDCKNCLLQPQSFAGILKVISKWVERYKIPVYNEETQKGLLRHIYVRKAFGTGETMVCLVINGEKVFKAKELCESLIKADDSVKTVLLNINTENTNVVLGEKCIVLYGKGYIEDILCGKRFRISPLSFYQVNHDQTERLYEKVAELAAPDGSETVLDLYCGTGTIGLTLANKVKKLIGIEIVPEAIEDAKVNAKINNIKNAEFICGDAMTAAKKLTQNGVHPDTLILDPPRKGCDETLPEVIAELNPCRIVYVSCDPATLARDCARLSELGYEVKVAAPYDMFPRTAHVETVVLMSRANK